MRLEDESLDAARAIQIPQRALVELLVDGRAGDVAEADVRFRALSEITSAEHP